MSYLVLARKWRPQQFEEVVGQRHVSLTLTSAIKAGRLSHAYLFAGSRGIGKTSMARILAKALNCEKGPTAQPCNKCDACRAITEGHCLDVLEIDGASNRGIDDIRQLRESVKYTPSSVRTKVYIIDEVHMLTTDAFNALLKTLEEPPRHVSFIMATTEPLKVPPTILSRCQRFDFSRLSIKDLCEHLRKIADLEGMQIEDDGLQLLARKAEGSVRDSLTLLDQVIATGNGPFRASKIQEILGLSGSELHFSISSAVIAGDVPRSFRNLQDAYQKGLNLQELAEQLVLHFRDILLCALGNGLEEMAEATSDERARLVEQVKGIRPADALRWLRILLDVTARMRRSSRARVHLEIALAEMAALPKAVDLGRMLERLREEGGTGRGASHRAVTDEAAGNRRPRPQGGASLAPGATDPWRSASGSDAGGRMPPAVAPAVVAESANGPRGALGGATVLGTAEETCPDFEGGWQQVVARIGREKAFLGSCLHESCVTGLVDGRLQIALQDTNGFKREQVERPANRRLILRVIEEVLGRPLGICIIGRGEPAASGKQRKAANSLVSGERRTRAHDEIRDEGSQEAGSAAAPRGTAAQSAEARVKRIARLMDGDIVGPAL